ncbi:MAG: hypothetical protein L3K16_08230 [Thermoplasmata archaeon]|nr:hypothetical protein [Thermoplasmata archaeon]
MAAILSGFILLITLLFVLSNVPLSFLLVGWILLWWTGFLWGVGLLAWPFGGLAHAPARTDLADDR